MREKANKFQNCFLEYFQNKGYLDGLVQKRHNSNALAMELRLSRTIPSIFITGIPIHVPKKMAFTILK